VVAVVRAVTPILIVITVTVLLISIGLIAGGVALVWMHGIGNTELTLFGNSFKSENVGVTGIFCGSVLGVLALRKLVGAVERIGMRESSQGK
jgi:hypothetical protein